MVAIRERRDALVCGGYTRVCVQCGRCGKVTPRPLNAPGRCVRCGFDNDVDARRCVHCGAAIPKAPGAKMELSPLSKGDFQKGG